MAREKISNIHDHAGAKIHSPSPVGRKASPADGSLIGDQIKKYRKQAKLSQRELGDIVGVTRNAVINWESGKFSPDPAMILLLCSTLHITPNELFASAGSARDIASHEWTLIEQYRQLSPVGQRIADDMIRSILKEEILEKDRMLDKSVQMLAMVSTAAAAGDGYDFADLPVEDYAFVFRNDRNEKADAIIRVKGDSMLPVYHDGDYVYVQYTSFVHIGEDVICSSRAGCHIKRMGEEGPYSLNKEHPFQLTSPDDAVTVQGRVLGIVSSMDHPSQAERDALEEIRHDEIVSFRDEHGLPQ